MKSLTYIEIDIPVCSLTFGVAPCTASIPTTGAIKCFNCKSTCQDRDNYDEEEVTLRFAKATAYLPKNIDCIPNVQDFSFTPARISLGENLGTRATLSVTFFDHPHSDTGEGYDKYLADRDYDPYEQGTYWGKFRARQPFLRGRSIRWITGLEGQALEDMETRHYIIESFDGPTPDGKYTLIAKDVLKLADGDRAQAPVLSSGFIAADITNSQTSAALLPSGIGNAEYPSSGYLAIGGKEIVSFTRSGDNLTITRAQLNTEGVAHKAQDRVQVVKRIVGEDAADILYDLFVNYAGVPAEYIPLADWQAETTTFIGTIYSADICEPTGVEILASEIVQQAALVLWWDDIAQKIRLQVLRGIVTDAARFTPDNTIARTLTTKEQPEKRLSRVQIYYGRVNPLRPLTDLDNYRSSSVVIDEDAEEDYGAQAIKTITARWIPQAGKTVADRLGAIQLGRFRDPPRVVNFDLMRYAQTDAVLGGGYRVESKNVQDATGAPSEIPVQVVGLSPKPDKCSVQAEEMLFSVPTADLTNRQIIFDANNFNVNLLESHNSIYPEAVSGDTVTCTINAGVIIGSTTTSLPAFNVGSWPSGVNITLIINGRIQGRGGEGGSVDAVSLTESIFTGKPGGTALYTRYPIDIEIPSSGDVWGGGGGGAAGGNFNGGGGGGGSGQSPGSGGTAAGSGGSNGSAGTTEAAGAGGSSPSSSYAGASGGGPGLSGSNSSGAIFPRPGGGALGGGAGTAIDGVSYITVTVGPGDIRGAQIN